MHNRKVLLKQIAERLGGRQLIWWGVRGSDAYPLLELEQFSQCFSFVAPLGATMLGDEVCLENLSHHRVDLNTYDAGEDRSKEFDAFYQQLLSACEEPSTLITYSPWPLVATIYFAKAASVDYLGIFHEQQAVFEHRAWVESELRREGIQVLPWRYISDRDQSIVFEAVQKVPHVLRTKHSSGGTGFTLIRDPRRVPSLKDYGERLFALAPYLEPNTPLNISGCIFPSGEITLHGPSLQLVGIPCCTQKILGYCGNDFARIRDLDKSVLDSLELMSLKTGHWLHRKGYIGAFGIDAVFHDGNLYLSEINPRFQGSSAEAARIEAAMGIPDIFISHIAAFLGLEAPSIIHVRDLVREQEATAQIYCYNQRPDHVHRVAQESPQQKSWVLQIVPSPTVTVAPGATLFKMVVKGPVTENGLTLMPDYHISIQDLVARLFTKAADNAF
jgi:hypothetical protein